MAWHEQYDRMKRWQYRIWLGVEHLVGRSDQAIVDVFYAFAQSCYHMVDWLDNDHAQHVRRTAADKYVESRPALNFCREICMGSKHAKLEAKKVRVTFMKTITSVHLADESGQSEEVPVEQTELFVEWGGKMLTCEAFARLCVQEWEGFLRGEGILK